MDAGAIVAQLGLEGHPEGGYYKRWYTSDVSICSGLPKERGYDEAHERPSASSIQYLLEGGRRSCLHRIRGDELWFWHSGGPLAVVEILRSPDGKGGVVVRRTVLGPDLAAGQVTCHAVPGGAYFGAYVAPDVPYALVSCVVTPGFDFADWQMHDASELAHIIAGMGLGHNSLAGRPIEGRIGAELDRAQGALSCDVMSVISFLGKGGTAPLPSEEDWARGLQPRGGSETPIQSVDTARV